MKRAIKSIRHAPHEKCSEKISLSLLTSLSIYFETIKIPGILMGYDDGWQILSCSVGFDIDNDGDIFDDQCYVRYREVSASGGSWGEQPSYAIYTSGC